MIKLRKYSRIIPYLKKDSNYSEDVYEKLERIKNGKQLDLFLRNLSWELLNQQKMNGIDLDNKEMNDLSLY